MEGEVEKKVVLTSCCPEESIQSLIELLKIRIYEEDNGERSGVDRIRESVAHQHENMKVGVVSARLKERES